jgi:hypothetical protein
VRTIAAEWVMHLRTSDCRKMTGDRNSACWILFVQKNNKSCLLGPKENVPRNRRERIRRMRWVSQKWHPDALDSRETLANDLKKQLSKTNEIDGSRHWHGNRHQMRDYKHHNEIRSRGGISKRIGLILFRIFIFRELQQWHELSHSEEWDWAIEVRKHKIQNKLCSHIFSETKQRLVVID